MPTADTTKPRLLERPLPATWWLQKQNYFIFVMRELSAVFVALVAVYVVLLWDALKHGRDAYEALLAQLSSPLGMLLSVLGLAFALLHTITFFLLAGKVLVIRTGEDRVPGSLVSGAHFALWIVVSGVVVWWVAQ